MLKRTISYVLITLLFQLSAPELMAQLTAAQTYARIRPGVVMVKTSFSATMYVKQVLIENRLFTNLLDSIDALELSTDISSEQKLDILVTQISNRPSYYFRNTADYRRHSQTITTSGTGFFVSENGYLVTNCHVVDDADDLIRRKFILSAFRQVTESNIDALQNAWLVSFTEPQKQLLYNTFTQIYSSIQSILLENLQRNISVIYSRDSTGGTPSLHTIPARLIVKGSSMPGKDVAILKIEPEHPVLMLPLARYSPRVGDRVYVFGYPDPVSRNEYLAIESTMEPSLTAGIVSGIRTTRTGWNVVQMDAEINHGNSGGPVCNEEGEVVGIATFGSIEFRTGVLAAGMNFSIPVRVLEEFLKRVPLDREPGKLTRLFRRAMEDYDQDDFRAARKKLEKVKELNPGFPGLSVYQSDIESHIEAGRDSGDRKMKAWLMVGALLAIMIFLLVVRRYLLKQRKVQRSWGMKQDKI